MKKVLSGILFATIIILLVFSCFGCTDKSQSVLGDWYHNSGLSINTDVFAPNIFSYTDKLTFNSDGTLTVSNTETGKHETFTWEYNKKEKCWVISEPSDWKNRSELTATIKENGALYIRNPKQRIAIEFWREA